MLKTEYISTKEKRRDRTIDFNWDYILPVILAFFISRASIMDKLTPFGLTFMTAYILSGRSNIFIVVSTLLGTLSFHGLKGIDYIVVVVAAWILFNRFKSIKALSSIKSSLVTGSIFILIKSISLFILNNVFIYDLFIVIFEGLVVFTLTYIFLYSLSVESIGKTYTSERAICAFITLALVLSGFHSLTIFGASIKNIISILFILFFGYTEGAFIGSTMGLILGMISYISQPEMPFLLAIYGLAGLLAGVFKDLGKVGSILGFLLGNGIVSFYINGYGISFLHLKELVLATILFSILYKPLDYYLSGHIDFITRRSKERNYSYKKDEMTVKRLNEISQVFRELGETFKSSVEENNIQDVKEVYELIDDVANSICSNCGMKKFCWEEGFYTTYHSMFKAISLLEEKIPLKDENLPQLIKDYCINKSEIKKEIQNHFDKFKNNNMWKGKIIENRILVSDQLEGIAKIMEDMAKDIYINPIFKEDMEEMVLTNLINNKVNVKDVVVAELEDNKIEIYVEVDKPYKKENSQENIRRIVSDTMGVPLKGEFNIGQSKKERQRFKLIRSNRYNALTEVVSKTNYYNGISGDSYTFGEGENSYFAALSDGMGVGRKANNESSIAINLFEKFLEAKFDNELALKTINSILMLKSNDEVFTTFDISLIDLYSGKLQIVKTGAPATFIRRKDRVDIINCQSLPVGILKDVDINVYEEYLQDGDIIIMMSDGILEANKAMDNLERWMKDVIANINSLNPKRIADEIMDAVKEVSGGKVKDDMTLLVTKVWKTV
ncbi:putative Stage II sporulation protein E,protein serine/threonine phosphatase [[Clostridium] ultunense Esp]|uniref:Putative Stage II sporulation protein E,protein serine/threonine phosphatase n=1 Tax=[Clostridium] ultunense Esp TaxID=1288971 RepID=M1ZG04_9FIRM|nr:stage II sporulation protein E [Schnuerera ultunensis]CCQ97329.1 putative Stage II sporulation protein E,protein serine/threonine phosphatase [[Clostridium] ultunense Esp]SHD78389.1 putative Stage II sporulation protein E,protein serine/threonine phosphatase [[Clostridium] ultunense Esp]